MPWDENPEGTMVETGEDWIDLPDETPEAAASSLASGDRPICPRRRVPRCHARGKHRVLQRQGDGCPRDARADREVSGLHVFFGYNTMDSKWNSNPLIFFDTTIIMCIHISKSTIFIKWILFDIKARTIDMST